MTPKMLNGGFAVVFPIPCLSFASFKIFEVVKYDKSPFRNP